MQNNANIVTPHAYQNRTHWTLQPLTNMLRSRFFGRPPAQLESLATRTWEIAPSETVITPPAFYLANQLERVSAWQFADEHPQREMQGGITHQHGATKGFLLKDAWLIDGTLFKNNACDYLQPRTKKLPQFCAPIEIAQGAVYCTAGGNQYFGQWLMDDCVTYPLAAAAGVPVTTKPNTINAHAAAYAARLELSPLVVENAFFKELIIFSDVGQNRNKHARFRINSQKILAGVNATPHPGVFILRGTNGLPRDLKNEMEIAEHLRNTRGFTILDPMKHDVASIVNACAGAQVVIGVEGSQLIHGILTLQAGGALVTLQPPNRFVSVYKHLTDRDHQHFAFVVGEPEGDGFRIHLNEVEQTLDLLPKFTRI